ncbi:hypothetical protein EGK59_00320 [Acinetobacter soli]|nr:hypothetical protein EGK59_00320 [Acinetobacter soli]
MDMNASRSHLFKLSVVALAISQVQLSYAEDATLPVIKLQAESNAEQSSEQTKAYIIKKQQCHQTQHRCAGNTPNDQCSYTPAN